MGNPKRRDNLIALLIALVSHLLLVGLLYLLYIEHSPKPIQQTELLLIALGDGAESGDGAGAPVEDAPAEAPAPVEPTQPTPPPTPAPKPSPKPKVQSPDLATQRHEESLRMQEAEKARKQKEQERQALAEKTRREQAEQAERARRQAEEESKRAQEEAERKRQAARQRAGSSVANAFASSGRGGSATASQGTGNSNGAGTGGGISTGYSLEGRSITSNGGKLDRPDVGKAVRGKIIVRITVNASGKVIEASIKPNGTNIADPAVRNATLAKARTTQFTPQEGASEQRGELYYTFDIE